MFALPYELWNMFTQGWIFFMCLGSLTAFGIFILFSEPPKNMQRCLICLVDKKVTLILSEKDLFKHCEEEHPKGFWENKLWGISSDPNCLLTEEEFIRIRYQKPSLKQLMLIFGYFAWIFFANAIFAANVLPVTTDISLIAGVIITFLAGYVYYKTKKAEAAQAAGLPEQAIALQGKIELKKDKDI